MAVTLGGGAMFRSVEASPAASTRAVFVAISPCRLFYTRPAPDNVGPRTAPLTAGDTFTVPVRGTNGNCTVPVSAVGVVMNVTVVDPTGSSYLTIYPGDLTTRPVSSNLNWIATSPPTPNRVTVLLGATLGDINLFNFAGSVNVLADVVGYYEAASTPQAGFGQRQGVGLGGGSAIEVVKLTDSGGSGPLSIVATSRFVATGAVTIGNQAGDGAFSVMSCQLQIDAGSGFVSIGVPQGTESVGNSNHDEAYNVALTAAVDRPAGTYNFRIVCTDTFTGATASMPISRGASLTVVTLAA